MSSNSPRYNVVVIGGGVTGLSALHHLRALGVERVALAHDQDSPSGASRLASGLVMGGQVDNFTRVSHAHGAEFAAALWRFGDKAFDALERYCTEGHVGFSRGRRLRLVTSDAELTEATRAVAEMRAHGFCSTLSQPPTTHPFSAELTNRILAVQDDGERAGVVDVAALLRALSLTPRVSTFGKVSSIEPTSDALALRLDDGATILAELVICAAHLAIGIMIPTLKAALVSVADQWFDAEVEARALGVWNAPGTIYSANHTYEWGAVTADGQLRIGGGRYLRPWAGIEAQDAPVEEKITKHLMAQLDKTFRFGAQARLTRTAAGFLDCRPCDELPIIGPMFGDGRVLVATGFMGSGLTMGFAAGRCLAELVANGRSDDLPRRLWPERLRTLEA